MAKTYELLLSSIGELAQAERVTKRVFAELSRDLLEYVTETEDVRPINALLGVGEDGRFILTAANWRVGCMYFNEFVPFTSNYQDITRLGISSGRRDTSSPLVFAKKSKKKWDKCQKAISTWLANDDNNIWTWQADNVDMSRPKDFAGDITKSITKGLEGDDDNEPLSVAQVLDAVLDADGITIEALFAALAPQEAA